MCALSKNFAPADRQDKPTAVQHGSFARSSEKETMVLGDAPSISSLPSPPSRSIMKARRSDRDVAVYRWLLRFTLGRTNPAIPKPVLFRSILNYAGPISTFSAPFFRFTEAGVTGHKSDNAVHIPSYATGRHLDRPQPLGSGRRGRNQTVMSVKPAMPYLMN